MACQAVFPTDSIMNTALDTFDTWLTATAQGRYIAAAQQTFLQAQIRHITGRSAWASAISLSAKLNLPDCLRLGQTESSDIISRLPAIPLLDNSLQTLFLPHGLDLCPHHDLLLKEAFRVLQAQGRLILTGFNPASLWRFSRAWQHAQLPTQPITLLECKHRLTAHGLNPAEGRFMAYAPAWFHLQYGQSWQSLEQAGDRWWPHHGAVYGLCAIKQLCPLKPIHETQSAQHGSYQLVFTTAGRTQSNR